MRALIRFGTAFCAVLFMLLLVPVAAAVGVDASSAQHIAPAPLPQLIGLMGLAGLGIVVQLSAKDKEGDRQRFRLDTDSEQFGENLEDYVEAKQDEVTRPLQASLTAMTEARDAYRDMVIGEIVRVETLRHAAETEGQTDATAFDAETHTAFLSTLTPAMLKLHYERAAAANVTVTQKTSGEGAPEGAQIGAGTGDDIPFGTVTSA